MQQILLIGIFKLALHVLGNKFAHPQENFLTVYTAFGTMHQHCCRPVTRLRWNSVPSQPCHWSAAVSVHCTKAVYTAKSAPAGGRICHPKHVGLIKKFNKWNLLHLVGCLHHGSSDAW
jgi:hypothetical protein